MSDIKILCIDDRYIEKYFILSSEKPFEQHQYFKILDEKNDNPICKVIKSRSIYKLEDIDNLSILKNAKSLGFEEKETFYWAEVLIEKELKTALNPSSIVIETTENEIYDYLYEDNIDDCLILGEIRGTESIYEKLKEDTYKDKLLMYKNKEITKQSCLPLSLNYKKLQQMPNIGIFGNSGSGKTFALKSMIEEILLKNLPGIIFDAHNEFDFDDYFPGIPLQFKKDFNSKVEYLTAGKDFGLRFPDLSNEDLKRLINSVNPLTEAQEMAIDDLREHTDSFSSFRDRLSKVIVALKNEEISRRSRTEELSLADKQLLEKYGQKIVTSSTLIALNNKLSIFENRNFFSKNYDRIITALKNRKIVVIRGENAIVAPMMGIIINDYWKKRKAFVDKESTDEYPPIITILDEAHIYAPKDMNSKAPLRKVLIDISREGRKYGMFLICATQRISELHNTIISQMSTKIILKTSQESDKQIIQKECGLSDIENNKLHMLDSGNGYIVSPIFKTKAPIAFQSRCNYSKPKITINAFDELLTLSTAPTKEDYEDYLYKQMPLKVSEIPTIPKKYQIFSGDKTQKTGKETKEILNKLVKEGKIKFENSVYSYPSDSKEFLN